VKKVLIGFSSFTILSSPFFVFAANATVNGSYVKNLIKAASDILNDLVVFLVALAVVWLIWNIVKYSMSESEDGKEKARSQMINGIIALAVIVSIWGLVAILRTAFGTVNNSNVPTDIGKMVPEVK
jgi:TRAP-type C4-dicarboxylate transport system permease large subunit